MSGSEGNDDDDDSKDDDGEWAMLMKMTIAARAARFRVPREQRWHVDWLRERRR